MFNSSTIAPRIARGKPCLICGDSNSNRHYGSTCCSGCKNFFRRTVRKNLNFLCYNNNQCIVTSKYRNSCRACRYAKCLEVGLDPKLVQDDRMNALPTVLPDINTQKSISVIQNRTPESWFQLAINNAHRFYVRNNISLGRLNIIPKFIRSDSFETIAQYFVAAEKLCDDFYDNPTNHMDPTNTMYKYEISTDAQQVICEPSLLSDRTKMMWETDSDGTIVSLAAIKRCWCRILCHYLDWVYHVPEIELLSATDKEKLIMNRAPACIAFTVTHRSVLHNINGVSFSGGTYFPYTKDSEDIIQIPDAPENECLGQFIKWMFIDYMGALKTLCITYEEYALLRLLALFTPSASLSPNGKEIVREAQSFYRNVLIQHVCASTPGTMEAKIKRFSDIMSLTQTIEMGCHMSNQIFSIMTIYNIGSMKGELPYEIHVRQCERK